MNGKGSRNRSYGQAYRDGWDRIFGKDEAKAHFIDESFNCHLTSMKRLFPVTDPKETDDYSEVEADD